MTTSKKLLTIFVLLTYAIFRGQNLVPNNSFEIYSVCPNSQGEIYNAAPWFQPCTFSGNTSNTSSSDIFNTCSTLNYGVPVNILGFQNARTGNGYAGIGPYYYGYDISEYIEVPLLSPLLANKTYCLEYYVSLVDSSRYSISNLGAYFSVDSLLDSGYFQSFTAIVPQVENSFGNILNNSANWTLVSGNFIANGGEKFLTIGNFSHWFNINSQINTVYGNCESYYYIDDVSLVECAVGVDELNRGNETINIYPNPATNEVTISSNNNEQSIIILYDISSRKLLQQTFTRTTIINIEKIEKGIYLYELRNKDGIIKNGKVIKQ